MELLFATMSNDLHTIKTLIQNGTNPNQQFEMGATALMVAIQEGNIDVVRYLLQNGANPNLKADGD
ncbi:MAG: ankyrin repeat domain-containing protein, partial [Brevinema sp.]